jgi:hypothetical protein
MKQFDLSDEVYREYVFAGTKYKINNPKTLYIREGGSTHRVLDDKGIVHCLPAPGEYGCVLRWKPRDSNNPVKF